MPLGCVILEGGGSAELRAWKAFGQRVNTIRKASPKPVIPEHALYAARKFVIFHSRWRHTQKDGDGRFEPSRAQVCCRCKRVGAHCQMIPERVRRLSERVLQKGLECSRRATHTWLSRALKGGAGPAHRWCGKEDALPELQLVIRDSQGNFIADPQCVAELYAHEWKREWSGIVFVKEIDSVRALPEKTCRRSSCVGQQSRFTS